MPKRRHLDDQTYFQIMERVAEENNPIWNEDRAREGYPTLSVDEEYLRILNDNAYNYRGFYDKYPESAANADSHWPDEFKTVWHPTFSTESTYSGKRSILRQINLDVHLNLVEQYILTKLIEVSLTQQKNVQVKLLKS